MVSSDFGNADARRQVIFGLDCAMAGAASTVAAAAPAPAAPAFLKNERRSIELLQSGIKSSAGLEKCRKSGRSKPAQYSLRPACPARSGACADFRDGRRE